MIFRAFLGLFFILVSPHLLAFDEAKFAAELGLEQISEAHPFNYLGVNSIYVNDSLGRQMLVVSSVPGKLQEMRILKQKDFLILEVPLTDKTYTSMALVGITESEIKAHVKTTSVWKTILREINPVSRAYGQDCGNYGQSVLTSISQLQEFFGSSVARGAAQCISSFLQGIWDSTGGQIADAYEGIKNLISDPRAFWDRKVAQFRNLKNFIMNFEVKMKQLVRNIAQLPAETKTMLICNFVGGIGTGVAIGILSGGAAMTGVILKVENYVSKIARLERVFSVLNRIGKLRTMPPEFFARLAGNNVPESVIHNLTVFAQYDLPSVVTGAMSCAL